MSAALLVATAGVSVGIAIESRSKPAVRSTTQPPGAPNGQPSTTVTTAGGAGRSAPPTGNGFIAHLLSGGVIFVQFASTSPIEGTAEDVYPAGQPPDEQVTSNSASVTGTLHGTSIALSFDGSQLQFGTIKGNSFTMNFPRPDGTLAPLTFTRAPTAACNTAVAALQGAVQSQDSQSAAAQAQAKQEKKIADAVRAVADDVSSLSQDGSEAVADAAQISSAVNATNAALTRTEAARNRVSTEIAQHGSGPASAACGDAETVSGDAETVAGEADSVSGAAQVVIARIGEIEQAASSLQIDFSTYQNVQSGMPSYLVAGTPTRTEVNQALTSAQTAVNKAVSTANGFITAANADVTQAFQVSDQAFQAGDCGAGPPAPSPQASISPNPNT